MDYIDQTTENEELVLSNRIRNYVSQVANQPVNTSKLCCDCKEEIDEKRIAVLPQAMRCIGCATEHYNEEVFKNKLLSTRGVIENMSI